MLPLFAGLAYAVSQIITRKLGEVERATTMSFYGNGVFLVGGALLAGLFGAGGLVSEEHASLAFLMRGWAVPATIDFLLMAACDVVAAAGATLLTQAYW